MPMTTETLRLTVSATTPVGISHNVTVSSSTVPTNVSCSALSSSRVMRNTIVAVADVWNANHVAAWYASHTRAARACMRPSCRPRAQSSGCLWLPRAPAHHHPFARRGSGDALDEDLLRDGSAEGAVLAVDS